MKAIFSISLLFLSLMPCLGQSGRVTIDLLSTKDSGPWPCKYYFLNYNDDIAVADAGQWYAEDADESEWIDGVGPFSNSNDPFLTTPWASRVRPILVRRHFTLNEQMVEAIPDGAVRMNISYDENPRVWLNGTLILEREGWNDNAYYTSRLTKAFRELLHEGDNVLAVSLMQGAGGGHIDYGLTLTSTYDPTGIVEVEIEDGRMKNEESGTFDLSGRRMPEGNLPKGIYIVDGKKKVISE